ncbi:hypothetical protein K2P97_10825 [bacterium]|nr:hypothetical protein [bacterium]
MRFIFAALITLASLTSAALTYEGKVTKNKNQILFLDEQNKKSYILVGITSLLTTYVNKLSDGDFVSIEGSKNAAQTILTVQSFNYIGLFALLGDWISDDSFCYNFSSFTEFSQTPKSIGKRCSTTLGSNFTYIISPSTTSWVILISGERYNYVGDLKFKSPRELEIHLYDSETGDILSSLRLRK